VIGGWRVAQPFGFELGEHPVWDDRTGTLWCVDVYGGAVVALTGSAPPRRLDLGAVVGAMALRDDGGIVALVDDKIGFFDAHGVADREAVAVPMPYGVRFNDAACDPSGRLLFGTAATDGSSQLGQLRRLDGSASASISLSVDGLVESNGLAWSPDGRTFYLVDSAEPAIRLYDYDPSTGTVGMRRADLACTDDFPGSPDGLAVDAAGTVWVALWQGGQVHRYAPDGQLLQVIETPTSQPTCCGFGGPLRNRSFLASGWEGMDESQLATEPHAGSLFVRDAPTPGLRAARLRMAAQYW
jgi:sugar lactone lactonase YvrE